MGADAGATLERIDATVARLLSTHSRVPPGRRRGYLEALWRLQLARQRLA